VQTCALPIYRVDNADQRTLFSLSRRWGVLFQDGALFSSLTVRQNVEVPLKTHTSIPAALRSELAEVKIALAGLPADSAHKYPSQLSGGMRKRAGLARALALDPDILFLDEPTAGLDPIGAASFDSLVRELQSALGLTILMVTHDMDSLYTVCDRVAVLIDRKVKVGTIEELMQDPHPWIAEYFGGPRGRAAAAARERLLANREAVMETRAKHVIVGLIVLLLRFGALAFAVWIMAWKADRQTNSYLLIFEGGVTGLNIGSSVNYEGVPIGQVRAIDLDAAEPGCVRVTIEVDRETPVRSDTTASLEIAGLTGGRYIQLSG